MESTACLLQLFPTTFCQSSRRHAFDVCTHIPSPPAVLPPRFPPRTDASLRTLEMASCSSDRRLRSATCLSNPSKRSCAWRIFVASASSSNPACVPRSNSSRVLLDAGACWACPAPGSIPGPPVPPEVAASPAGGAVGAATPAGAGSDIRPLLFCTGQRDVRKSEERTVSARTPVTSSTLLRLTAVQERGGCNPMRRQLYPAERRCALCRTLVQRCAADCLEGEREGEQIKALGEHQA